MTAIVPHDKQSEPVVTRAGYLWPGLGHLLVNEKVHGVGLMSLTAVTVLALVLGAPHVLELVFPPLGASIADLAAGTSDLLWAFGTGALFGGLSDDEGQLRIGMYILRLVVVGTAMLFGALFESRWRGAVFGVATLLAPFALALVLSGVLHVIPWPDLILGFHATLATISLLVTLPLLWFIAHRRAHPRQLSEEEANANRTIFLRLLRRHTSGMMGLYGVLILLALTVFTPLLAPFDPDLIDIGPPIAAPGWWDQLTYAVGYHAEPSRHGVFEYIMGTDEAGRDVLSRLLFGGRISLFIGLLAVSIAATIGTSIGAAAGYFGGAIDRVLMWFVDLLLAMPRLILLLAVVGIIDVGGVWRLFLIVAILGLTGWMSVARIVRSQVLSLKRQDFIQAALALGYSPGRIVFVHLIPNALAPVIVYCSLAIGGTMLAEAGLSFLGLGVQPPTSTWGVLVNAGRDPLRQAPWISLFPGFAIVFAVMSFNLMGDGLRDALDPKHRS